MSSNQVNTMSDNTERPPVEVTDWNELIQYVQYLCRNTDKKFKICMVDEEQEEIRIENKDEFDTNVKYARDHGLKSLILIIYIGDERKFDGIYHIRKSKEELNIPKTSGFPLDKLQNLRGNVLVDKWYIPVKSEEALGVCLTAAIKLAQEGKLDTNVECKQFIETIVPEAFRKLQTTQSVFSWPREVQYGTFDMIELLIDLVGTRLRYPPVPITLLNTLAITFDTNTTFSQKHKDEQLPTRRIYKLDDEEFLRKSFNNKTGTYGWLRSFIQRFIAQNGLKNLRAQFEYINNSKSTTTTAMEYNCLLKLFSKCYQCIEGRHFRLLFTRSIRQAIKYFLDAKKHKDESSTHLNELNETLIELCFNYEMNDEVNAILELLTVPINDDTPLLSTPIAPLIMPLEQLTITKKSKSQDNDERLAEDMNSLTMNNGDAERKNIKKQRTEEQVITPLFSRNHPTDCTTDDLLSSSEKRSLKRKHRREQQRHIAKKENKRSNTMPIKTYDRSNPDDIIRFFGPMTVKVGNLYDQLQTATCNGNIREVLKIEEKLKLLRPYSARFVADENTPDGTPMQPGQVFRKGWILLNDGSMPWSSEDIQLVNLADGIKVVKQPVIPVTAPHDRVLITVDYMCAHEPGTYESKWILSYRHQTFGPMIWCSIEVGSSTVTKPTNTLKETFEVVDVPLPACFDLSKPYQLTSSNSSSRSSFILPRTNSTDTQSEPLVDIFTNSTSSDNDSLSTFMRSPSPILTKPEESLLIEIPALTSTNNNQEHQESPRSSQSMVFVDTVVTNIFSVAKQAGSTAKAIFNTLQANDETTQSHHHQQQQQQQQRTLVNTRNSSVDDFFEHVDYSETTNGNLSLSNDPMEILIEMGFVNREKNQRLLVENKNDLNKVIELLADDDNDDVD
ncbi:unnamed protein product [Rotaria sp. Silwood2]|nr:unnamed protein product [Rotaria sp. Silwood2]CAF2759164.1 unnamed protein product [Rotaria sp. Silwood2]CAF4132061.1 unnamed protein product [Rotaria sp. Silwood2]CAF4335741.1 unnamed protein product [Rotaria sp. Silwood2]